MSKEMEIASLIPQVFFDIIARVIPGVFLLSVFIITYLGFTDYWCMFKEWLGPSADQKSQLPSATILFLLSFVAAYILSIVLWGLRFGIHLFLWRNKSAIDCETGIKFDENYTRELYKKDICIVKRSNREAGSRITKIKAEIHMTMTISTGLIIAFFTNIIILYSDFSLERIWMCIILIIMFIGAESAKIHFRDHMKSSITNVKELCEQENKLLPTKSNQNEANT
jgi:hypothetical protein